MNKRVGRIAELASEGVLALDLRLYLGIRDDEDVLKPLAVGSNLYSCDVLILCQGLVRPQGVC